MKTVRKTYTNIITWHKQAVRQGGTTKLVTQTKHNQYHQAYDQGGWIVGHFNTHEMYGELTVILKGRR